MQLYTHSWWNSTDNFSQVWAGNPAKYLRVLSKEEQKFIADSAESYSQLADEHRCESCSRHLSS